MVVLVCCEYLPKAWFQSNPPTYPPFRPCIVDCRAGAAAIADFFNWLTAFLLRGLPAVEEQGRPMVTREEIDILAKESAEHGNLTPKQRIMIHGGSGREKYRAIMVPRKRMVFIDSQASGRSS